MRCVSTTSWHFAYYKWLRGLYGRREVPDQTSLCPYCQTILWGSIFCIVLSPLLVTGWGVMRIGRWMLKLETRLDPFFVWLDKKTMFVKIFSDGPENFEDGPLAAGFVYSVIALCIFFVIALAAMIVIFLGYGFWHILDILAWFGWGFLYIGWAVFWTFSFVGRIENWLGQGAYWLFTNGPLWAGIAEWAIFILGWLIGVGITAVVLGYGVMIASRTKIISGIWAAIVTKVNGFAAARKERNDRVEAERVARLEKEPPWTCPYCYGENMATRDVCHHCDCPQEDFSAPAWFVWIGKLVESCIGKVQRIGREEIHVLGWFSIIIEFIKAAKNRACPLIEFISPEKLRQRTIDAAQESVDSTEN